MFRCSCFVVRVSCFVFRILFSRVVLYDSMSRQNSAGALLGSAKPRAYPRIYFPPDTYEYNETPTVLYEYEYYRVSPLGDFKD